MGLILLAGCGTPQRCAIIDARQPGVPRANLVLGPTADHAWLATQFAGRSDWPTVEVGHRYEDVTYFSTIQHDTQVHYDRFGSFYNQAQTVRTGVLVH